MATLVLQMAGSALGAATGIPFGATLGQALGGIAGNIIDRALINATSPGRRSTGPRLSSLEGLNAQEGAPIPRLYGRARIGGQVIWATRFEEVVSVRSAGGSSSGGKGGALAGPKSKETTYSYFANLAVGLCEGEIAFVRRIWADGKPLDLTKLTMRVHRGGEDQLADPLIVAKEGVDKAPAYRGLAYVVFERLPLESYGNRVPQLSFEVVRPVGSLGAKIHGVNLIPGAGEFIYDDRLVLGGSTPDNLNQLESRTDLDASLDQLAVLCPNLDSVTLIVSWFGDDLRAGQCRIEPKVEQAGRTTTPDPWRVNGLLRHQVNVVSVAEGRSAYGGTPSDSAVLRAIAAIKARGWRVNLHPFLMMDIPQGNAKADPHTGSASQPAYPWRGEITLDPAPGRPGSPDATPAAAAQIAAFVGAALPVHFTADGNSILYAGPAEWSLRRMVLHYAKLAALAGGVDGFILGSEYKGLTRARSGSGTYPMAGHLAALAGDVRTILGSTVSIIYGADWTEYGAHAPATGEVRFPLDPLWASPHIDAVGIDYYPPLSDWRDGENHADAALAANPLDPAYLASRLTAGEGFDWYYADDAARAAQIRTPITDGLGKPWLWRVKDLKGWWQNAHIERVGGIETSPTAWVPEMKPIRLLEIGCPAVDRGANAPHLFVDPKSANSGYPPFSRRFRDDLVQNRTIAAVLDHVETRFDANPAAVVPGGRMIDPAKTHVWCWDARPYPAFPDHGDVWGDAGNWETGHWLNGRLEAAPLDELLAAILADYGFMLDTAHGLEHCVEGFVIDRPMSARDAIEPLCGLYGFDLRIGAGRIEAVSRNDRAITLLDAQAFVPDKNGVALHRKRMQETELPRELTVGFVDEEREYRKSAIRSRRLEVSSRRMVSSDTAIVSRPAEMQRLAEARLRDIWIARESVTFTVPPQMMMLQVGDVVQILADGIAKRYAITTIGEGSGRDIEARAIEPLVFDEEPPPLKRPVKQRPPVPGRPDVLVLDLPAATAERPALQYLAATAEPWPGALIVWRSLGGQGYQPQATIIRNARIGTLLDPLVAGFAGRWDHGAAFEIVMQGGTIGAVEDMAVLAGENRFALQHDDGRWEILSAAHVELVAEKTYRLSRLLRGQGGSDLLASASVSPGARLVLLDEAIVSIASGVEMLGVTQRLRVVPYGLDHADPRAVELSPTPGPVALQPYAPVHLSARRTPAGIALTWIRRSRLEGDAWEVVEIPLGEEQEAYTVSILNGSGQSLRDLTSQTPSLLYPMAAEIADFGSAQTQLRICLAQVSTRVGPGFKRDVILPIL